MAGMGASWRPALIVVGEPPDLQDEVRELSCHLGGASAAMDAGAGEMPGTGCGGLTGGAVTSTALNLPLPAASQAIMKIGDLRRGISRTGRGEVRRCAAGSR